MKTIAVLLGLMFLMGGSAYGEQSVSSTPETALPAQGGQHHGPPPEAYKACEGKTAGSAAQLTNPEGGIVTGICRMVDNKLVLRPDHPTGNSSAEHHGPPPEAYTACEGKTTGSSSQFVNPRGETVKGTCAEESGKMVLRPDANKGNQQGQTQTTR